MSLRAAYSDGYVVAQNLRADHRHSLALCRIDLAWHDAGPRLVRWKEQFTNPRARTRSHHADVVRNFVQGDSHLLERSMAFHNGIVGRKCLKFVVCSHERVTRRISDVLSHEDVITFRGIDSSTNGRSPQSELLQVWKRIAKCLQTKFQLGDVSSKFLTQSQRGCIHQMGSANLNKVSKGFGFRVQRVAQALNSRNGLLYNRCIGRNVHGRWKRVVGTLTLVDVVVGVHSSISLDKRTSCKNMGTVGHNFIDVHVALGAGPCLPNYQRKLVVQFPCQHFFTGRNNEVFLARIQDTEFRIGHGRGSFQVRKCLDNLHGHGTDWANLKIVA